MATVAATDRLGVDSTPSSAYARFAGVCAILAGVITLLYAVSFIILVNEPLSSIGSALHGGHIWLGVSLWRGARA